MSVSSKVKNLLEVASHSRRRAIVPLAAGLVSVCVFVLLVKRTLHLTEQMEKAEVHHVEQVYELNGLKPVHAAADTIEAFESRIGHALPGEFRHYLSSFGGGEFSWTSIDVSDMRGFFDYEPPRNVWLESLHLLSADSSSYYSIWREDESRLLVDEEDRFLLFGDTIAGDRLYVGISGDCEEAVLLETGEGWFPLGDNIWDFFARLSVRPESERK